MKNLNDFDLISTTKNLVQKEREVTLSVLRHLREIESRRLYAKRGFSSLVKFCIQEFQYSESAAVRRVLAMRLMKDVPEVERKIQKGELNLTNAAKVQSFLRNSKKFQNQKLELVQKIESKSSYDVEKTLRTLDPLAIPKESVRRLDESHESCQFVMDEELRKKLERIKDLADHSLKSKTLSELFHFMADAALKNLEAKHKLKKPRVIKHRATAADKPSVKTLRYIPKDFRQDLFKKQKQCAYVDPVSKRRCDCKRGLEIDHIIPMMLGGQTEQKNLRLLCPTHNKLLAIQKLGGVMNKYLS